MANRSHGLFRVLGSLVLVFLALGAVPAREEDEGANPGPETVRVNDSPSPSSCHFKTNTQRSLWLPCAPSRQIMPDCALVLGIC